MTKCAREHCHGSLLIDDGRQVCSLCARVANNPEPPPWVPGHLLKDGRLTEQEKADRYRARQRRYQARRYKKVKEARIDGDRPVCSA
jgi:hypothetical protein